MCLLHCCRPGLGFAATPSKSLEANLASPEPVSTTLALVVAAVAIRSVEHPEILLNCLYEANCPTAIESSVNILKHIENY